MKSLNAFVVKRTPQTVLHRTANQWRLWANKEPRDLSLLPAPVVELYERTGLPLQSYDLWEQRKGILTFTCTPVCGELMAAAHFAEAFGELERAMRYRGAAAPSKSPWKPISVQLSAGSFCAYAHG